MTTPVRLLVGWLVGRPVARFGFGALVFIEYYVVQVAGVPGQAQIRQLVKVRGDIMKCATLDLQYEENGCK